MTTYEIKTDLTEEDYPYSIIDQDGDEVGSYETLAEATNEIIDLMEQAQEETEELEEYTWNATKESELKEKRAILHRINSLNLDLVTLRKILTVIETRE